VAQVTKDATLADAIEKMLSEKAHRVWIVESADNRTPVGLVSLTDVLNTILSVIESAQ